jgi:amidase
VVLVSEFKQDIAAYLASTPPAVKTRTLKDLSAFNQHTPAESVLFGEDVFKRSESSGGAANPEYPAALQLGKQWARQALETLKFGDSAQRTCV